VKLIDNPGTWLDFTDLVFIDPVGTGYSRSLVPAEETKKQFYSTDADIHYLSRIIYDWLVKNGRLSSRKYLVGESYGGYRGPRITHFLQTQLGVAMNGVVLVSPYLNPALSDNGDVSPVPWMLTLPSITAAHLEREHKLTAEAMVDVIAYTRGEYATDLMKGRSDPEATPRIVKRVTEMTGLEEEFVRRAGGRLEIGAYLREVFRESGKIGSVYDSNVTGFDPYPFASEQRTNDPLLESIIAPTTTAMVDFCNARRRLEDGGTLQCAQLRCESPMGSRQPGPPRGRGARSEAGRGGRPEVACNYCSRLERPLVSFHGLDPNSGPDAGDGRSDACRRAGVSGRPHVLQPFE
jgi:carboxypeptidase C (cathepsin A)